MSDVSVRFFSDEGIALHEWKAYRYVKGSYGLCLLHILFSNIHTECHVIVLC